MATKIVKTLKFPNSSDDYQINAVKQSITRATKSILTLACEQGVDTEVIWFGGSDGTSVGMPSAYCVCNIKKGNNHRTLIDCYCLTDGRHYINGNTYANTTDTGVWTGWIEQLGTDTDTTYDLTASKSSTNGNVKLNLTAGGSGSGTDSVTVKGSGKTTVTTDANGVVTINTPAVTASDLGLEQAMKFLGSTTTAISDGSTTKTITVDSKSVTAENGNVVLYNGYEYVWTGSAWEQLGQEGSFSLKTHTHTVSYTPAGTVSTPTITVTPNTTTVNSITAVGTLPSLTYEEVEASKIDSWSAGTLPSASLSGGSASLTGSVSTGPNRVVTLSHSHSNPTLTFSAGTLPSLTHTTVKLDNITAWSAGTLPTKGSNTTVVTGIKSATSTQPTFTGTAATLTTDAANS